MKLIEKLLNLMGRTAHALVGVDLLLQGRVRDSERYVKDFISITEEEIRGAFYFLIPEAQKVIIKKFKGLQNILEDDKEIQKNKEKVVADLGKLFSMIDTQISLFGY